MFLYIIWPKDELIKENIEQNIPDNIPGKNL
jgi:hypothetical protein